MHLTAYGLLLLTTLFWGGNSVAGKLAVDHISPMLLTSLRWGVAFFCLWAAGRQHLARDKQKLRESWPLLALLGFLGFSLFNVALYSALLFTTAINVSIEQAGMPMLIFLANFLLFRQRVSWGQIAGFTLSLLGVALTAAHGELNRLLALAVTFGAALMIVAVVVYSAYTVLLRFRPPLHWMTLMIVLTGSAFVTSLPFAIAEFLSGSAIAPDGRGWIIVAYTAVFPSILSQILYIRGVEFIGANRAGLFINLVPIFGTLLAIAVLREAFFLYHALALTMVLGGIALAEWSGKKMAA